MNHLMPKHVNELLDWVLGRRSRLGGGGGRPNSAVQMQEGYVALEEGNLNRFSREVARTSHVEEED